MTKAKHERVPLPTVSPPTLDTLPVLEYKGQLAVDSRDVAALIERPHWSLIRSIRTYAQHLSDNKIVVAKFFIEAEYIDEQGKPRPRYLLTEQGCDFIVNKATGEKGAVFTARYVDAFHTMRSLLLERQSPVWQDIRSLGKEIRRRETDAIKLFVDYATAQGSRNAVRYFTTLSWLADRTVGITERNKAQTVQLTMLLLVENVIAQEITTGVESKQPYKAIYQAVKDRLAAFSNVAALAGWDARNEIL